jgi:hypothetical protein
MTLSEDKDSDKDEGTSGGCDGGDGERISSGYDEGEGEGDNRGNDSLQWWNENHCMVCGFCWNNMLDEDEECK